MRALGSSEILETIVVTAGGRMGKEVRRVRGTRSHRASLGIAVSYSLDFNKIFSCLGEGARTREEK